MKKIIPAEVKIFKNNIDIRDYRLDASKLLALGFRPKKNVEDAINEIKEHYSKNINKVDKSCFSIDWLSKKYKKI